jgi:hypothetical protein
MKAKQVSIFLENRSGRLKSALEVLYKEEINIRALTIAESSQFGILRLIVNAPDKAIDSLKSAGFTAVLSDVIAVEVEDKPGGLYKVLQKIAEAGLNVEYMYAFLEKKKDNAIVVFSFDDVDKAIEVLKNSGVSILTEKELSEI